MPILVMDKIISFIPATAESALDVGINLDYLLIKNSTWVGRIGAQFF